MALTDEAIDSIKSMIVSGELKPGDRLPREADLAVRLGLSRNSLREAVKALSLIKILDVRQGDGTYVTSLDPALLLDALSFVVDMHRDDSVLHFFQVRRMLEPAATAIAATTMSDDQLLELGALLDQLGADPSVDDLVANDLEFHHRIAAATGNPVLCSLLDAMSAPTRRARVWRGRNEQFAVARTISEHRSIYAAIQSRQPDLAHSWALVHIAGVELWLREHAVDSRPVASDD